MKINSVPLVVALLGSALVAYAFYSLFSGTEGSGLHYLYSISAFIAAAATLGIGIGSRGDSERITVLIKTVASVFFVICIGTLGIFLGILAGPPVVIIVVGLELLVYFLIVYALSKSKQ